MDKLSVFGSTGFIGSRFMELYGDKCFPIPRTSNFPHSDAMDTLYLISTTNNYNVFEDLHLDINTNLNKLMNVLPNVDGTFNFISSWFVYGDGYNCADNAASESSPTNPTGFYSITKKTAEDLLVSYCKTFGKKYRIIRLCNVIGGHDKTTGKKKNAFSFLLNNISEGNDIDVYRGDNYRNFMHVDDVCRAINLITTKGVVNEIYNVGSETSHRIIDVVEYAIRKTQSNTKIHLVDVPQFHRIVQAPNFFMDCNKLKMLGFVPTYDVYSTMDEFLLNKHGTLL